jgi:HAE1 family hydrophobic/amphiphilic exporter-1
MSIPRTAIERPITMYMICGVIVLLGAISLVRLPVDLMPDVTFPSITVRVSYGGVGPLEMDCAPVSRRWRGRGLGRSMPRVGGSSTVRLNFAGTN